MVFMSEHFNMALPTAGTVKHQQKQPCLVAFRDLWHNLMHQRVQYSLSLSFDP